MASVERPAPPLVGRLEVQNIYMFWSCLACGYVKILQPVAICSYFRNNNTHYTHTVTFNLSFLALKTMISVLSLFRKLEEIMAHPVFDLLNALAQQNYGVIVDRQHRNGNQYYYFACLALAGTCILV